MTKKELKPGFYYNGEYKPMSKLSSESLLLEGKNLYQKSVITKGFAFKSLSSLPGLLYLKNYDVITSGFFVNANFDSVILQDVRDIHFLTFAKTNVKNIYFEGVKTFSLDIFFKTENEINVFFKESKEEIEKINYYLEVTNIENVNVEYDVSLEEFLERIGEF